MHHILSEDGNSLGSVWKSGSTVKVSCFDF